MLAGIAFSPHAANLIRPLDYALGSEINVEIITMYFTRLVLGVQLVLAGVQLPGRYLQTEWKSLALLLGPGMVMMWLCSSLLIWALVPNISILQAFAIAACVTPTDPVLSNSIVKGKFADKNVPRPLQRIIVAESGANDGLGYPFLFIALYVLKFTGMGGEGTTGGAGKAIGMWFYETWGYTILLSILYGAVVGWISMKSLHWAEEKNDWFRLETLDDSLQPTVDMLLNLAIFMWFGAVCPWDLFAHNDIIPIYRLVALGVLILLLRRLPVVLAMHRYIRQVEHFSQAAFLGFFGPIGVGAIFYLSICREFLLEEVLVDGEPREDAQRTADAAYIVVWFLVICSIVVHGLSVPVGKAGYYVPRTISSALSTTSTLDREQRDLPIPLQSPGSGHNITTVFRNPRTSRSRDTNAPPPQTIFRLGRSVIHPNSATSDSPQTPGEPDRPVHILGEDGHLSETLHSTCPSGQSSCLQVGEVMTA
ncbi:hypothetical protein Egran_06945 [Elaphomyces granulatus]|uniref:Cation/H+ exchanger transmembrane domain-containing protein n=1 Tax=Elaphomyces granulatus TaxID=519963 RepID=A0A232LN92_9EURO|nr:hypothetical protein Egran_06945 [Elaphomyces granulatus]